MDCSKCSINCSNENPYEHHPFGMPLKIPEAEFRRLCYLKILDKPQEPLLITHFQVARRDRICEKV